MFHIIWSPKQSTFANCDDLLRRFCIPGRLPIRRSNRSQSKSSASVTQHLVGCAIAGVFSCSYSNAATTSAPTTTPATIQSDGGIVKSGDVIIWQVNKPITLEPNDKAAVTSTACFPVRARFNVTSVIAATKGAPTTASAATPSNTQIVSGHFEASTKNSLLHPFHRNVLPPKDGGVAPCGAGVPNAESDKTYDFTADQLSKHDFYRQGFTWGGLVIPYKFYFKDKSIKSNSSIVGFAGYEGWFPGVSLSAVLAAGAGTTPSTSTSTTATSTTARLTPTIPSTATLVTYTVATGLIMAFGDSKTVKAGLMFGRDYQGNASAFPYENKWWMALSIGAGF